ncbi:MAG: lysophospholipase [Spirochaetaceae bacterium]|jgi:alpha-beta hydrolase superfamily lysophospholipase|nr:lysophospholipase [Spirochaetaceae bacterium]
MDELNNWISGADGNQLFVRQWKPEGRPRGVVHIVHGMAEHSLRYGELARRLCGGGFEVWAADMRGHGKTAEAAVNSPGTGGLLGHCADRDGFSLVVSDIEEIHRHIAEAYPDLPLFLLGHSWGSFIAQAYIETYRRPLGGCILSGTRGPDGIKITVSAPVMKILAFVRGRRTRSPFARSLVDGAFNKPFRPNRTNFDWLSRDEPAVDAFVADPLCGKICSVGFYRDLTAALSRIHKPKSMDKIPRELPVYVFSGSADPVGDMGNSPTALVNAYRSMGITDLEFVLYPDARHESLNETNREEVMENLLAWLSRHCSPRAA